MGNAFLVNQFSGGGASGTLTVKSLDAGIISIMCIDNYDVKNPKPVKVKANETVVFKGLAAGDWEVYLNDYLRKVVTIKDSEARHIRPFSAAIKVTYSAKFTCTCSDGTTTFTDTNSTDAEKTVIFTVLNKGTWTVTTTNGTYTKSQDVEISTAGVTSSVILTSSGYYYKRGAFADSVNYKTVLTPTKATATEEAAQLTMKSPSSSKFEMYVQIGPINLSAVSKLSFLYNASVSSGEIDGCLFISKDEITSYTNAEKIASRTDTKTATGVNVELDVAELSGNYYIYAGTNSRGKTWGSSRTINVLEVAYSEWESIT